MWASRCSSHSHSGDGAGGVAVEMHGEGPVWGKAARAMAGRHKCRQAGTGRPRELHRHAANSKGTGNKAKKEKKGQSRKFLAPVAASAVRQPVRGP